MEPVVNTLIKRSDSAPTRKAEEAMEAPGGKERMVWIAVIDAGYVVVSPGGSWFMR